MLPSVHYAWLLSAGYATESMHRVKPLGRNHPTRQRQILTGLLSQPRPVRLSQRPRPVENGHANCAHSRMSQGRLPVQSAGLLRMEPRGHLGLHLEQPSQLMGNGGAKGAPSTMYLLILPARCVEQARTGPPEHLSQNQLHLKQPSLLMANGHAASVHTTMNYLPLPVRCAERKIRLPRLSRAVLRRQPAPIHLLNQEEANPLRRLLRWRNCSGKPSWERTGMSR